MSLRSDFLETVRRLPLFADMSEAELTLLAQCVARIHFGSGTVIFGEGDLCRELLIVEAGSVKILKTAPNGRQQLLSIERRGGSLAEVAVFDGGGYPATAEAASDGTLLRIPAETFRKICIQNPEIALKVFRVLGRRLRHLVALVEELSFSTVRGRLLAHIVRLAAEADSRDGPQRQFQLTENNEELAVRLGTVRELISRNLGRLHGDGLIHMSGRTVTVPDIAAVREEIAEST